MCALINFSFHGTRICQARTIARVKSCKELDSSNGTKFSAKKKCHRTGGTGGAPRADTQRNRFAAEQKPTFTSLIGSAKDYGNGRMAPKWGALQLFPFGCQLHNRADYLHKSFCSNSNADNKP